MKSKLLILTISLLVVSCGSVFGQGISIDSISGLNGEGRFETGATITVHFHLSNPLVDPVVMISNGFVVKAHDLHPDFTWGDTVVAERTDEVTWDLDDGYPCWFDLGFFTNYFSCDGGGADTIGFGGAKGQFGTGMTTYDGPCWDFIIGPFDSSTGIIVVDSCWYPPAGSWMWGQSGGVQITPSWDGAIEILGAEVAVEGVMGGALPDQFALRQNYPNPFNPTTDIQFELPTQSHVRIEIYNVLGQKVRDLVDETREAGYHVVQWDGRDNGGSSVSSGVYFSKMQAGDYTESKKMMMLK